MALITDPDNLSQGASNAVADMVFTGASGATVDITSAGGNLPTLAVGEFFEVRDHSTVANNGLYEVDVVNTVNEDYSCTKVSGSNPANASSEAATTLGETGAGTEKSVFFDTALQDIRLLEQGNLSTDGVTLQALYSFIKEEWKNDPVLIPFPFPMVAITPEQFEFIDDWELFDDNTRKLIRTGGWREYNESDELKREWTGIITLGTFEDSASDLAYYQLGTDPTDTGGGINFTFNGPVNEPIKVFEETIGPVASLNFNANNQLTRGSGSWITDGYKVGGQVTIRDAENAGNNGTFTITALSATVITVSGTPFTTNADDDTAVVAFNNRSAIKLFLRVRDGDPNGKTYAQSRLADIGVTSVDNKVFRFPLSNATDLKISETDANIAANAPYTSIVIRYFDQAFNREVDSGTNRNFGIVIDVGTHSGVDGSAPGGGSVLTTAEGGMGVNAFAGGTLRIHEGTDENLSFPIVSNTATTITVTGTLALAANISFTAQRATPIVATAEEIYEKVQYLLRQATDIDSTDQTVTGKTADSLLVFVGDTLKAGTSIPTNPNGGGSGVIIEGFDTNDTNRLVFVDNTGAERTYPFVAAGTITFNTNLEDDGDGYYWMFYEYTERFTNTGFSIGSASGSTATLTSTTTSLVAELANGDYIRLTGFANEANNGIWRLTGAPAGTGPWTAAVVKYTGETVVNEGAGPSVSLDKNPINSPDAIIVNDDSATPIQGAIATPSVGFTFDYDGNVQGGRTAGTDAAIRIRAIGLDLAQFVETTGTITRATGLSFSVVAGLERNYSNL